MHCGALAAPIRQVCLHLALFPDLEGEGNKASVYYEKILVITGELL